MHIKLKNVHKLDKQKSIYIFLLGLIIIGIIVGIIFRFTITNSDKLLVDGKLDNFFKQIKTGTELNYASGISNSILSNMLYVFGIWFLGISIIGLPVIIVILFMKSFIIGFSIASIIAKYGFFGVFGSITYIFPHLLLGLILSLILSFYAIMFSVRLFSNLFLKKDIDFKKVMNKYLKILIIVIIGFLIESLIEVFVSPYIIKLFTFFIK